MIILKIVGWGLLAIIIGFLAVVIGTYFLMFGIDGLLHQDYWRALFVVPFFLVIGMSFLHSVWFDD